MLALVQVAMFPTDGQTQVKQKVYCISRSSENACKIVRTALAS